MTLTNLRIAPAGEADREKIEQARHQVYAVELGQYPQRADGRLREAEDVQSVYLVAMIDREMAGFVGITPPESPRFSVDRFLRRESMPFAFDAGTFEVRALTVLSPQRGSIVAMALMYAAFRWVEARGGTRLISIGRRDVVEMYRAVGMRNVGREVHCGAVTYELLSATVAEVRESLGRFEIALQKMREQMEWEVGVSFERPSDCYHGGAFFEAIGEEFDDLRRRDEIINADVLDAWFPPAPKVIEVLQTHLDWVARTSPPTQANGLCRQIAAARGVDVTNILTAGGSSPLMFLALPRWLNRESRVLLLEPTYGEYGHILEQVVRCRVDRFELRREEGYRVDAERLARQLENEYDVFIWVNPNNPTGCHVRRRVAEEILRTAPGSTRVWVDEAYIDYISPEESLEKFAAKSGNVVVCKSLSKGYALSGLRAGYLCAPPQLLEDLRGLTPPWSVSLAAQVAAVAALQSPGYYAQRHAETHELRHRLSHDLQAMGITEIMPGCANYLMMHLPKEFPSVAKVIEECRGQGLFLREIRMAGGSALRVAVKDFSTNQRMIEILQNVAVRVECTI